MHTEVYILYIKHEGVHTEVYILYIKHEGVHTITEVYILYIKHEGVHTEVYILYIKHEGVHTEVYDAVVALPLLYARHFAGLYRVNLQTTISSSLDPERNNQGGPLS